MKTLKEFATKAGVTVGRCDPEWGGTYSYKTKDCPNSTCCGYRTEASLYKSWLENSFGKTMAKAVLKLIENQKQ